MDKSTFTPPAASQPVPVPDVPPVEEKIKTDISPQEPPVTSPSPEEEMPVQPAIAQAVSQPTSQPVSSTPSQPQQQFVAPPDTQKKKGKGCLIAIIIAVVLFLIMIISIIIGVFYVRSKAEDAVQQMQQEIQKSGAKMPPLPKGKHNLPVPPDKNN